MFERISHISTAIATIVALLMLSINIKNNNKINERQAQLNLSQEVESWKRAVLIEAIFIKELYKFDEIESFYLKRASQNGSIPVKEKKMNAITEALSQLIDSKLVVLDKNKSFKPHFKHTADYTEEMMNSLKQIYRSDRFVEPQLVYFLFDKVSEKDKISVEELIGKINSEFPNSTKKEIRRAFMQAVREGLIRGDNVLGSEKSTSYIVINPILYNNINQINKVLSSEK